MLGLGIAVACFTAVLSPPVGISIGISVACITGLTVVAKKAYQFIFSKISHTKQNTKDVESEKSKLSAIYRQNQEAVKIQEEKEKSPSISQHSQNMYSSTIERGARSKESGALPRIQEDVAFNPDDSKVLPKSDQKKSSHTYKSIRSLSPEKNQYPKNALSVKKSKLSRSRLVSSPSSKISSLKRGAGKKGGIAIRK